MTGITIYNVQRKVTPKAGNLVMVLVFCTTYHGDLHLHKVSSKYLKQFSSNRADTYITEITVFNVQRAISKGRLSRAEVVFLCSAPRLMMLYIFVNFCQNI